MAPTPLPKIVRTISDLRSQINHWRQKGETIAMVPTMGALHAGHLSLVEQAKSEADHVLVSIFVNPTQFAPGEDFDSYPRTEEEDCAKLAELGVELAFCPNAREMYPNGFATSITVDGPSKGLESDFRPHFFSGVATVVAKLLLAALPDVAIFGQKDYQQLKVIDRLVKDLNIPTKVIGGETMREPDGLAMSSRNAYLSKKEREQAVQLITILRQTAQDLQDGKAIEVSLKNAYTALEQNGFKPDYISLADAQSLSLIENETLLAGQIGRSRLLAAAWMGKTRLIDNIPV